MRHVPRRHRPTLTQVAQPRLLVRCADALMQRDGLRQRQIGGEVDRAGVHATAHAAVVGLAHVRIQVGHASFAHVHRAHAHRCADPLVQVDANEIGLQVRHRVVDLAKAMCGVDNHIDAACPRALGDLCHRQHKPMAMADLGQQHQFQARQARERLIVGLQDLLMGGHHRQCDALYLHATTLLQPAHRVDHAVVVDVGVQHLVARSQPVVAADQREHRFGGATGQRDLVGADAKHVGHLPMHGHVLRRERVATVPGIAPVHFGGMPLVAGQGLLAHRAPVAVLQVVHFIGDVEVAGDGGPVRLVTGQHIRRRGRCRNVHRHSVARGGHGRQ